MKTSDLSRRIGVALLLGVFIAATPENANAVVLPTDITGNVLWLDAADATTITSAGGFVSQWTDKSTVGTNHFTQGNAGYQPQTGAGTLGGLNVLTFNGTSQHLLGPAVLAAGDDDYTYLAVWNPAKTGGIQSVYEQGSGNNQRASLLAINGRYGFNGQNNDRHDLVPFAANEWRLTAMQVDDNVGPTEANITVYDNGREFGGRTTNPGALNVGTSGSTVGKKEGVFGEFLQGNLAELIVYDRNLSGTELTGVGAYLADKYGMPSGYAPGAGPVHQWTFNDGTAADSIGNADGALSGAASIAQGKLSIPGSGKMLTSAIENGISAKTLVVWTSLTDPNASTRGSALTLQDATATVFDGIVYGEREDRVWMAGSDGWNRSQNPPTGRATETVGHPREVMMAIAYGTDNSIKIYRDGQLYAEHTKGSLVNYDGNALAQIGPRHGDHADVYNGYVNEARIYAETLTANQIQDLYNTGIEPTGLAHQWTFEGGNGNDSVGSAHGTLFGGAAITKQVTEQGSRRGLQLDGVNDYMGTTTIDTTIAEKTLVAWVKLDNLQQQSGGVLTLENPTGTDVFDSIVYGERTAGQWMNGSNGHQRSDGVNNGGPVETSTDLVMMAIAYGPGGLIDIFRDGELYASYTAATSPITYTGGLADVLLGVRHSDIAGGSGTATGNDAFLAGWIDEAQIYDHALTLSEVRWLYNQGTVPEPGTALLLALAVLGLALRRRR